jgi:outer membrane protein TolC
MTKTMKYLFSLVLTTIVISSNAQTFYNLNDFLAYAEKKSISLQSSDIKIQQASQGKLVALLSIPDVNGGVNGNFTYNTKLPVSILPASAFGGPADEIRELSFGSKFQTGLTQNIDVKLINLEGLKNIPLAKLNLQISKSDALLNKKTLYENIASIYFNIVQLQAQSISTQLNIDVADTLVQITNNKYKEGLVKQQDVNDAMVNLLNIQETKKQIDYTIIQQYSVLKNLCDVPDTINIKVEQQIEERQVNEVVTAVNNPLSFQNSALKEKYALENLQKIKQSFLPTLSFVASNSYNSYNQDFTIFGGNWINSNYIGLKLNWALPSSNTFSNRTNAKYNLLLAQNAKTQATIKSDNEQAQLNTDLEKAISQNKNQKIILNLQRDTYIKNKNLYEEGMQSLDRLLSSFNNKVNAQYNYENSQVAISLAISKIEINNKFSTYAN